LTTFWIKQAVKKHIGFYLSIVGQDSFQIQSVQSFSFAAAAGKIHEEQECL